jgi:2-iminobutanoate/2-iminopropanoate deaminase
MEKVETTKAPGAIGPYSQGIKVGNLLFTSGQIPIEPISGLIISSDIVDQTEQVMKNLGAIFEAAGTDYSKTIKTTCFLANMDDFTIFNEIYAKYFTEKPARSCVAVKKLPKNVLCEVEAIVSLE